MRRGIIIKDPAGSITQEVEEVALENITGFWKPFAKLDVVALKSGGNFIFSFAILSINSLLFLRGFWRLYREQYSRGRKRRHSKCFRSRERRVGSTPTCSANYGTAFFFGALCRFFVQNHFKNFHLLPLFPDAQERIG